MKVISLLQPWATLMAIGAKRIETRSWATKYRGPLAIHASKALKLSQKELCWSEPFRSTLLKAGYKMNLGQLPLGVIIATCNLVDVRLITENGLEGPYNELYLPTEPELSFGDYTPGRYAWILEDIKPLSTPIPAKGQLGLWEYDLKEANHGNII